MDEDSYSGLNAWYDFPDSAMIYSEGFPVETNTYGASAADAELGCFEFYVKRWTNPTLQTIEGVVPKLSSTDGLLGPKVNVLSDCNCDGMLQFPDSWGPEDLAWMESMGADLGGGGGNINSSIPSGNNNALDALEQIQVYPNPTNGTFTIEVEQLDQPTDYRIIDTQGRIVHRGQLQQTKTTIHANELSTGLYLLNFVLGEKNIVQRLMIK